MMHASHDSGGLNGSAALSTKLRKLAYFPGVFLLFLAIAFLTPAVEDQPVIWPIVVSLAVGGGLLGGLAWASRLRITDSTIYVRFFSFRGTKILWDSVASSTYGINYPSLGMGITLRDGRGRKVIIHFSFWDRERSLFRELARRLTEIGPAMDVGSKQVFASAMSPVTAATTVEGADGPRSEGTHVPQRFEIVAAIVALVLFLFAVVVGFEAQHGNWLAFGGSFSAGAAASYLASRRRALDSRSDLSWLELLLLFVSTAVLTLLLGREGTGYFIGFVVALVVAWLMTGRSHRGA
jgi:hypothetical protein